MSEIETRLREAVSPPTTWVNQIHTAASVDLMRAAIVGLEHLRSENTNLKREVERLRDILLPAREFELRASERRREELEREVLEEIGNRDSAQDELQHIDLALGGSGEWSNNYDCGVEAFRRAGELRQRCEELERQNAQLRDPVSFRMALDEARNEGERRAIRADCTFCTRGCMPGRGESEKTGVPRWHHLRDGGFHCNANLIYESIYQRNRAAGGRG